MGIVKCFMCNRMPQFNLFYCWTSSRYFPREKLIKMKKIKDKGEKRNIHNGLEVCMPCLRRLKEE